MDVLLVPTELAQAIFNYLNLQPRAQVNDLCIALQQCKAEKLEAPAESEAPKKGLFGKKA